MPRVAQGRFMVIGAGFQRVNYYSVGMRTKRKFNTLGA